MLHRHQLRLEDVEVVSQEYSIAPFLRGEYVLSQVTNYNELIQIFDAGFGPEDLQVLSPGDFECAIPGDMIFTSQRMIADEPDTVRSFVHASIRGWERALANKSEAIDIVLRANRELSREQQLHQLQQVELLIKGSAGAAQIGSIDSQSYVMAQQVLVTSGQLRTPIDVRSAFSRLALPAQ
jgi:NitT/TauT family transport system substrate-binding protein